jgi:hypothetical protein
MMKTNITFAVAGFLLVPQSSFAGGIAGTPLGGVLGTDILGAALPFGIGGVAAIAILGIQLIKRKK